MTKYLCHKIKWSKYSFHIPLMNMYFTEVDLTIWIKQLPNIKSNNETNKSGRLALASSVLSSILTYYMQISWLPQSICDSIDQTTRNFIWRDSNNKGINLVGWDKIARPKIQGGLGIRPAREAIRPTFVSLGSLFGIWCSLRISSGSTFSQISTLQAPPFFIPMAFPMPLPPGLP
jgi:hypothetical protein